MYFLSFVSKSIQFPFIIQLTYCQKLDFEVDPNNKKVFFLIPKSIQFPFITQLKYCQKLDFDASP